MPVSHVNQTFVRPAAAAEPRPPQATERSASPAVRNQVFSGSVSCQHEDVQKEAAELTTQINGGGRRR